MEQPDRTRKTGTSHEAGHLHADQDRLAAELMLDVDLCAGAQIDRLNVGRKGRIPQLYPMFARS